MASVRFDQKENSQELYPHFQGRTTLPLRDAAEVMIACHDQFMADSISAWSECWNEINKEIQLHFSHLHVTDTPTDLKNSGKLDEIMELMNAIYDGYENNPSLWTPIMNGLVRQQGGVEGVPDHQLLHMTGGLPNVLVDAGIIGTFSQNPWIYVIAGKDLPNRKDHPSIDEKFIELLNEIYKEYQGSIEGY